MRGGDRRHVHGRDRLTSNTLYKLTQYRAPTHEPLHQNILSSGVLINNVKHSSSSPSLLATIQIARHVSSQFWEVGYTSLHLIIIAPGHNLIRGKWGERGEEPGWLCDCSRDPGWDSRHVERTWRAYWVSREEARTTGEGHCVVTTHRYVRGPPTPRVTNLASMMVSWHSHQSPPHRDCLWCHRMTIARNCVESKKLPD